MRDSFSSPLPHALSAPQYSLSHYPMSYHSSQDLLLPAHPCCTAEPSSFSGSSTISTPEGLLFLPLSWQRKAKLTLWHLPKLFLVVQQNLSFLTSSISSSTRFMSQLPSAAQAWLGAFGSGLRTSILACICDCYPLTPPSYPSNLTEYRVGKWLITALTRFTVQGILWVLLQRSFIPLCFPKWLLSCSKVFPKYPVGPGKALPVDEGLSGVLFCFVPLGRCSVAKNVWWLQSYEEADNAMSWEHPRHDTKLEMKRKNEEKTRIHVHPFRVSCHDCQHHPARNLDTSRSLMVSRQILDGADLDQICNTHPSHSTPLLLPLLPLLFFAQTDVRTSKWVSLALKSFLSNLPPQSLQNANYNISLLEMLLWCLKLSQLRMDIAIPWVLFSRFTFLSSTHNLINQNRLGIRPGYTQFEKDFW